MLVYLSGSIEFAEDSGRAWRAKLTPFLRSLGHRVYDPAADEKKNLSDEEVANFRAWKTGAPEKFTAAVRKIVHWDLNIVEKRAGCVVCYWDAAAGRGAGTQAEVTAAFRTGKPVYLVTPLAPAEISGWILACATRVFRDFDELRKFFALRHGTARSETRKDTEQLLYRDDTDRILKAAVTVHRTLGPGFLEKIYVRAVCRELQREGVAFEMEKRLKVFYEGMLVGEYLADLEVEQKIIVEFKCCEGLRREHEAQLLNYLKATGHRLGLLLNFGRRVLEVRRRIL